MKKYFMLHYRRIRHRLTATLSKLQCRRLVLAISCRQVMSPAIPSLRAVRDPIQGSAMPD